MSTPALLYKLLNTLCFILINTFLTRYIILVFHWLPLKGSSIRALVWWTFWHGRDIRSIRYVRPVRAIFAILDIFAFMCKMGFMTITAISVRGCSQIMSAKSEQPLMRAIINIIRNKYFSRYHDFQWDPVRSDPSSPSYDILQVTPVGFVVISSRFYCRYSRFTMHQLRWAMMHS